MTILIAESGSTKTEWRLLRTDKAVTELRSPGFNPNVQSQSQMKTTFDKVFQEILGNELLDEIWFYGAGLGGASQKAVIQEMLTSLLPVSKVFVHHDMQAAAKGTQRQEGIVCILGTGSNSCHHRKGVILQKPWWSRMDRRR